MKDYYLAIDLGASGGRHILGSLDNGELVLNEVHRFSHECENYVHPIRGSSLIWNTEKIYEEIVRGLIKCRDFIKDGNLVSLGIDTWGVDYVLLDKDGEIIEPAYAYRDSRTEPFINTLMPHEELFKITGTAFQSFNTVYQLLSDKAEGRLDMAEYMLQLPEYFSQRLTGNLTGKTHNEYTMASTTGLLDAGKKTWSNEILEKLGLPEKLFKPVKEPPYEIGLLDPELQKVTGFTAKVMMIASHDTASAAAVVSGDVLYISSGTWSLLGVIGEPVLTDAAREAGYSNEGAHNGKIRFQKNIMGLWVLQNLRKELNNAYSFTELENMAREEEKKLSPLWINSYSIDNFNDFAVNINGSQFFSPLSMINEIKNEYDKQGKKIPESPAELAFSVYASLANCYKIAVEDLENITGKTYKGINIIGGGSKDLYLNELTARITGKTVRAGPSEATSMGNILLQMKRDSITHVNI